MSSCFRAITTESFLLERVAQPRRRRASSSQRLFDRITIRRVIPSRILTSIYEQFPSANSDLVRRLAGVAQSLRHPCVMSSNQLCSCWRSSRCQRFVGDPLVTSLIADQSALGQPFAVSWSLFVGPLCNHTLSLPSSVSHTNWPTSYYTSFFVCKCDIQSW